MEINLLSSLLKIKRSINERKKINQKNNYRVKKNFVIDGNFMTADGNLWPKESLMSII